MTTPISSRIDLHGEIALVTGGARGIGQAIAIALAREGASVVVADLLPAEETIAAIEAQGVRGLALTLDVTNREQVEQVFAEAAHQLGPISILVNNAGTCGRVSLENTSDEIYNRDMDTIMRGTYLCTQTVYSYMKQAKRGKIINISSVAGKMGGPTARPGSDSSIGRSGPAYAAAKGAVIAFTKWVAKDGGQYGICCNAIAPGPIDTEMIRGFEFNLDVMPIRRVGQPQDIAQAVVFLASPAANFISGSVLNVDGGMVMD